MTRAQAARLAALEAEVDRLRHQVSGLFNFIDQLEKLRRGELVLPPAVAADLVAGAQRASEDLEQAVRPVAPVRHLRVAGGAR